MKLRECLWLFKDFELPLGLEQFPPSHSSLAAGASKLCVLFPGPNRGTDLMLIIHTQPLRRWRHNVKFAVYSLQLLRASTPSYRTTPRQREKLATAVAAPEGVQKNVEWALSVISIPTPTKNTRASGADTVRAVNPPTLHVTLYNTGTVSTLSTTTTHTHLHIVLQENTTTVQKNV